MTISIYANRNARAFVLRDIRARMAVIQNRAEQANRLLDAEEAFRNAAEAIVQAHTLINDHDSERSKALASMNEFCPPQPNLCKVFWIGGSVRKRPNQEMTPCL